MMDRMDTDKDGMMRGVVRIRPPAPEQPEIGLDSTWEGHFLVNDIARDLIQVERQIKALERLEELESSPFSNLHEWIFDITKATVGVKKLLFGIGHVVTI